MLVAAALAVAAWELCTAMASGGIHAPVSPVILGGTAMFAAAYESGTDGLVVALALSVLAVLVWRLFDGADGYLRDVSAGLFVLSYLPLLAGSPSSWSRSPTVPSGSSPSSSWSWRATSAATRSACCSASTRWRRGSRPRSPGRASPARCCFCCVAGAVALPLLLEAEWWQGLLLGLAVVCTAVVGDLCESMVKRDLGVKDMGTLLPGHGGLMDRLDSLLPSAPVVWLLLSAFVVA